MVCRHGSCHSIPDFGSGVGKIGGDRRLLRTLPRESGYQPKAALAYDHLSLVAHLWGGLWRRQQNPGEAVPHRFELNIPDVPTPYL